MLAFEVSYVHPYSADCVDRAESNLGQTFEILYKRIGTYPNAREAGMPKTGTEIGDRSLAESVFCDLPWLCGNTYSVQRES